jgi:hypothetical protein
MPGAVSRLKEAMARGIESREGREAGGGPSRVVKACSGSPLGCLSCRLLSTSASTCSTLESSASILATLDSFPCSICFTQAPVCVPWGRLIPSTPRLTGQSTRGYAASLDWTFRPPLSAGASPTLGSARKSSRVRSEGSCVNLMAILSAASSKALAVDPKMGLFVVGSEVRERKRV